MNVDIEFPGGLQVAARFNGFLVPTDQSPEHGGGGTAPQPFDLFLGSLGTCAGFYALRFCQERGLETRGLHLSLWTERDAEHKRMRAIHLDLRLPTGFPERYRDAILRAVDQCAVKRLILDPPLFIVTASASTASTAAGAPAAIGGAEAAPG